MVPECTNSQSLCNNSFFPMVIMQPAQDNLTKCWSTSAGHKIRILRSLHQVLCAGANSYWKTGFASPESLSGAWSALKLLVDSYVDLKKDNRPQHGMPHHHWLWKILTGPQAMWILCLSALPLDSRTLISKGIANVTLNREYSFQPFSCSQVFVFSLGK